MKQITMKELFQKLGGTPLDIFVPKDQFFFADNKTIPISISNYGPRPRIESIRLWDFRYEGGKTKITVSFYNGYSGYTTLYFPKEPHFDSAATYKIWENDLVRMVFSCNVRLNK